LLRANVNPIVFCDRLRLSFFTKPVRFKAIGGTTESRRVCVRYGGKGEDGKSRTSEEELSVTLDYGTADWPHISLALREFVSNALDACFEAGFSLEQASLAVRVEVVDEDQVRAKAGYTRVFVPLTPEVQEWHNHLNKWFLHFAEPGLVAEKILPKNGRSLTGLDRPVIYRRGVFVREFEHSDKASLFDYNLPDLKLNESRTASDWDIRYYCGMALADSPASVLSNVFLAFTQPKADYWEFTIDEYGLLDRRFDETKMKEREENWKTAFESVAGENGVLVGESTADICGNVERKGYRPVQSKAESWAKAAEAYGVRTEKKVLTEDDLVGRTYLDATQEVISALDWAWDLVVASDLANGRDKPPVGCLYQPNGPNGNLLGLYRDGKIYIHRDIANGDSTNLRQTILEELAHHCSGCADFVRGFQEWLLALATALAEKRTGIFTKSDKNPILLVTPPEFGVSLSV
jgi:hypothetical protein